MLIMKKIWKASALSSSICAVLAGIMLLCTKQNASAEPVPVETELGAIIQGRLEEGDSRLSAGQYADAVSSPKSRVAKYFFSKLAGCD
ncbi:hypothetical protein VU04_03730 [Desulfobulbus sp. TB]|nr:hypothetical protein [Desulfobulbus sp. TB]